MINFEEVIGKALEKVLTSKIRKSLKKQGYTLDCIKHEGEDDVTFLFEVAIHKGTETYIGDLGIAPYGESEGCVVLVTSPETMKDTYRN